MSDSGMQSLDDILNNPPPLVPPTTEPWPRPRCTSSQRAEPAPFPNSILFSGNRRPSLLEFLHPNFRASLKLHRSESIQGRTNSETMPTSSENIEKAGASNVPVKFDVGGIAETTKRAKARVRAIVKKGSVVKVPVFQTKQGRVSQGKAESVKKTVGTKIDAAASSPGATTNKKANELPTGANMALELLCSKNDGIVPEKNAADKNAWQTNSKASQCVENKKAIEEMINEIRLSKPEHKTQKITILSSSTKQAPFVTLPGSGTSWSTSTIYPGSVAESNQTMHTKDKQSGSGCEFNQTMKRADPGSISESVDIVDKVSASGTGSYQTLERVYPRSLSESVDIVDRVSGSRSNKTMGAVAPGSISESNQTVHTQATESGSGTVSSQTTERVDPESVDLVDNMPASGSNQTIPTTDPGSIEESNHMVHAKDKESGSERGSSLTMERVDPGSLFVSVDKGDNIPGSISNQTMSTLNPESVADSSQFIDTVDPVSLSKESGSGAQSTQTMSTLNPGSVAELSQSIKTLDSVSVSNQSMDPVDSLSGSVDILDKESGSRQMMDTMDQGCVLESNQAMHIVDNGSKSSQTLDTADSGSASGFNQTVEKVVKKPEALPIMPIEQTFEDDSTILTKRSSTRRHIPKGALFGAISAGRPRQLGSRIPLRSESFSPSFKRLTRLRDPQVIQLSSKPVSVTHSQATTGLQSNDIVDSVGEIGDSPVDKLDKELSEIIKSYSTGLEKLLNDADDATGEAIDKNLLEAPPIEDHRELSRPDTKRINTALDKAEKRRDVRGHQEVIICSKEKEEQSLRETNVLCFERAESPVNRTESSKGTRDQDQTNQEKCSKSGMHQADVNDSDNNWIQLDNKTTGNKTEPSKGLKQLQGETNQEKNHKKGMQQTCTHDTDSDEGSGSVQELVFSDSDDKSDSEEYHYLEESIHQDGLVGGESDGSQACGRQNDEDIKADQESEEGEVFSETDEDGQVVDQPTDIKQKSENVSVLVKPDCKQDAVKEQKPSGRKLKRKLYKQRKRQEKFKKIEKKKAIREQKQQKAAIQRYNLRNTTRKCEDDSMASAPDQHEVKVSDKVVKRTEDVKPAKSSSLLDAVSNMAVDVTVAASEKSKPELSFFKELVKKKTRGGSQSAKKLKKKMKRWRDRQQMLAQRETARPREPPPRPICTFYIEGRCNKFLAEEKVAEMARSTLQQAALETVTPLPTSATIETNTRYSLRSGSKRPSHLDDGTGSDVKSARRDEGHEGKAFVPGIFREV
ncbi:predicted protein [Nematostella vectensis]|uniref:Uncharacterized protein n=1 Tax=Nematostella vectensis TaxID=45351 RepID=A7REX8_NEMVE|nr:predicted protein [Nematostella vectensis]|eukprot:XP_001641933.1 predicted protein [Nematostella vectensis]